MNCRSCASSNIVDILSLGNQYLSDFVEMDAPKPPQHPLDLIMCKDCTLVQIKETTPTNELYTNRYGYRSGINKTMRDELRSIVIEAINRV